MHAADLQRPPAGALYVDHVSHFVADLDAAAGVFEALGFRVTPASAQRTPEGPVGASNRCVMLEAGYIELLSPTHDTPAAGRMRALMARYDGVHLVCFGTPDAQGEHARLAAHGFSPQPLVDLQRETSSGTVRFKVVRPAPEAMPEGRIQFVEQLTPELIWQAADVNPFRLGEVYVAAAEPAAAAARWAEFSALLPRAAAGTVRLDADRGAIVFGPPVEGIAAPGIVGYSLACRRPEALAARCAQLGIAVRRVGARRVARLPAALGGYLVFG
ncbi:MAG TPA: VOC family protein [Burkholderiales bacterium]